VEVSVLADIELHDRAGRIDLGRCTAMNVKEACGAARTDVQREDIAAGGDGRARYRPP
jgi:hypothetical protein